MIHGSSPGALAGWSTDGSKLYFTETGLEGQTLEAIDLGSGAVSTLFVLQGASPKAPDAALSPDGNWVVYRDQNMNLTLVHLEGTDSCPLTSLTGGVSAPYWSGDWLGFGLLNFNAADTLVLVQPQPCRAYLLSALHGDLEGMNLP